MQGRGVKQRGRRETWLQRDQVDEVLNRPVLVKTEEQQPHYVEIDNI